MKTTSTILLLALASTLPAFTPRLPAQSTTTVVTLHSFSGVSDGSNPSAGMVQGKDGNFYGTTQNGGDGGAGSLFAITPAGVLTTLHSFTAAGPDGANPLAGLIQGSDGNFYGATEKGGSNGGVGTIFQLTPTGGFTTLHTFTGADGASPFAGLVQGSDGNFYGATENGGSSSEGTVFQLTPAGAFNTLHSFTGGASEGAAPKAGLVQGKDGNFYGTTSAGGASDAGTVFSINPAGGLTTLYSFTGPDGSGPTAGLVQGSDGYFYGTTYTGGSSGVGTVFRITATGAFVPLYSFPGGADGAYPPAALVQGRDGNFYGTTGNGGSAGDGTVFSITPAGALTTLHSFTGTNADGSTPAGGLILGSDGNFYGTTSAGGSQNAGTVFRVSTTVVPTVTIISPPTDITVVAGAVLNISVNVDEPGGVLRQEQVTLNGVVIGSTTAVNADSSLATGLFALAPRAAPSTPGTYTLIATATDSVGGQGMSTRTITVIPADPSAPSSTFVTAINGRTLPAGTTVTLTDQASTADGSPLAEVDFFADGVMFAALDADGNPLPGAHAAPGSGVARRTDAATGSGTLFQASYTMPAAGKQVNLVAMALSKLKTGQVSTTQTITAAEARAGGPPTITLNGLTNGQHLIPGQAYTVTTAVSSGGSALGEVEYYLNGAKISTVNPVTGNLPAVTFAAPGGGKYALEAIATDTAGVSSVAAPINVTVDQPVVTITVAGNGEAIEGSSAGKAVVQRTGDTSAALKVKFTVAGSALPGVNYLPIAGNVIIPAGASKAKIKLKPIDNGINQGPLVAKIKLKASKDGSYVLGSSTVAKIKVLDND